MPKFRNKVDEMLNQHLSFDNAGSINWNNYVVGKNLTREEYRILFDAYDFLIAEKLITEYGPPLNTKITQAGRDWQGYESYSRDKRNINVATKRNAFKDRYWIFIALVIGIVGYIFGLYKDQLGNYFTKKYPVVDTTTINKKADTTTSKMDTIQKE